MTIERQEISTQRRRAARSLFFVGVLTGAGAWEFALHQHLVHLDPKGLALAFTLYPVSSWGAMLAVIGVAAAVLIGFQAWTWKTRSPPFFLGVLTGTGLVFSFDIVWVHWIFGLHHLTNTEMDLVLEPLFVLIGFGFMWFGITRERQWAAGANVR